MKISKSIQRRVFLIFGSFTLFLTIVYSGLNILVAYVIEDEVLEKVVAHESLYIEKVYEEEGKIVQPRVDYMKLYLNPELAPKEIAEAYKNNTLETEVFTQDKVHYHIRFLYFDKKYNPLLVAEVSTFLTVSDLSSGILHLFFIVFIGALLLSLWLTYLIAKRTTKPISTLAQEVMLKQNQSESFEFSTIQSNDEVGYLANVIESVLTGLNASMKRENDFNRDVSHELRTPLTVVNNTLTLAKNRSLSESEVEQLKKSASQMNHIVTTLLALSRAESIQYEEFFLRPFLEDCVLSLHHKLEMRALNITLDVTSDYQVYGNKQLTILLVNNLIENAIQHAAGNELLIRQCEDTLSFENAISKELVQPQINNLTEQNIKHSNSQGFGQGLYLVRRIIETLNWHFDINSDSEGYKFSIFLKSSTK